MKGIHIDIVRTRACNKKKMAKSILHVMPDLSPDFTSLPRNGVSDTQDIHDHSQLPFDTIAPFAITVQC